MKCSFQKQSPKVIYYPSYKCFDNIAFKASLCKKLSVYGFRNINCEDFKNLFLSTLNEHAPMKKRYIRANNAPFMNKELCKAIMSKSRLRSPEVYKKQRNFVMLLRNTKISYYENLNVKCIQDNKKFWKHVKPLFSQNSCVNNRINFSKTMKSYQILLNAQK